MADARAVLLDQLQVLIRREAAIARHLRGEDGRNQADLSDIANFNASDEVLEGLQQSAQAEISQLRDALARVDAGTYGQCTGCGASIAPGRLAALPSACACVACAARAEPDRA